MFSCQSSQLETRRRCTVPESAVLRPLRWLTVLVALVSGLALHAASEVILYCAQDQELAEPILADFTRQTGIKVRSVFDSEAVKTVGLVNRLYSERSHPACDVFWGNEEFRTRWLADRAVFRETNGWAAFGQRSRRLVINTRLVPPRGPQPTWLDLTNSIWRGKISMAYPLFGTTATHLFALRERWGEAVWLEWCRALAANRPFLEEGNSRVVARVASGEAWVGITDSDDIAAGVAEGKTVAALPLGPESLRIPNTVAVIRGSPHPPAAERLWQFLQSPEVRRRLIAGGGLEPESAAPVGLNPDWTHLLHDLDRATGQLKEVFRR
jgi:iron(III) transport system substrate-binding protein